MNRERCDSCKEKFIPTGPLNLLKRKHLESVAVVVIPALSIEVTRLLVPKHGSFFFRRLYCQKCAPVIEDLLAEGLSLSFTDEPDRIMPT